MNKINNEYQNISKKENEANINQLDQMNTFFCVLFGEYYDSEREPNFTSELIGSIASSIDEYKDSIQIK